MLDNEYITALKAIRKLVVWNDEPIGLQLEENILAIINSVLPDTEGN